MIEFICIAIIAISIIIPFIRKTYFIYSMIISNFLIFFLLIFTSPTGMPSHSPILEELSFNPLYFKEPSKVYTIITSMFIHYDIMHILGNMIALFFIGIPFEYRVGRKNVALIYILGGIFANIFFSIARPQNVMLLGASGAIFSLLGAFAASFPNDRIVIPVPLMIIFFARMRVITAAILFALLQIFFSIASQYYETNVAYLAHLGGLIGGIAMAKIVIRERKEKEVYDYKSIEKLITNEKQREIYSRIITANEKEIKEAWLSYLVKELKCPKCGGKLELKNGRIYCKKCGYI